MDLTRKRSDCQQAAACFITGTRYLITISLLLRYIIGTMSRLVHKGFQTFALLPEWILIKRAKLGEKEAFGKLYEHYVDRLYRYVFFRVENNRELAEDLVQSAFVKAWEKLETFEKGSFQAWLYTIVRNTMLDHFRTEKPQIELHEAIVDDKQKVEEQVLKQLEVQKVMDALRFLTDEQKELITLKFVEDMSNKEIAQILGKEEDAIRAMQYRALKELKKRLL